MENEITEKMKMHNDDSYRHIMVLYADHSDNLDKHRTKTTSRYDHGITYTNKYFVTNTGEIVEWPLGTNPYDIIKKEDTFNPVDILYYIINNILSIKERFNIDNSSTTPGRKITKYCALCINNNVEYLVAG